MAKSDFNEVALTRTRYTPADHAAISPLKPAKVISASTTGEHGPWALIEFEGGFTRAIDLPSHKDANHIMFESLEWHDRWKLRRAAELVVPVGDGTEKVYKLGLSFVSATRNKRGKWIADNDFDVPQQEYDAGWLTGYRVARELFAAMKSSEDVGGTHGVQGILMAAGTAAAVRDKVGEQSRRGAALGFMRVVEAAMRGAARHTNIDAYIDQLETQHQASAARMANAYAEEKAQRIAKSVATRKARAAERRSTESRVPSLA